MLEQLSAKNKGLLALVIGGIIVIGAALRLSILKDFFYVILIIAGVHLILWGLPKSEILPKNYKK